MRSLEVLIRLTLAVVIGGLIGYERGLNNRAAGFRTHILVCVGAAVTSMIQLFSLEQLKQVAAENSALSDMLNGDLLRLGAQVISGVGFLGVGTIIHEKGSVKGLTTAASLWVVACVGIAVGFGYYELSIMSSVCVFFVLVLLKGFEHRFIDRTRLIQIEIIFDDKKASILNINQYFKENDIRIKKIEYSIDENEENRCFYTLVMNRKFQIESMLNNLSNIDYIISIKRIK